MTPLLVLLFGVHPATAVGTICCSRPRPRRSARSFTDLAATSSGASSPPGHRQRPATAATLVLLSMLGLGSGASRHLILLALGAVLLLTSAFLLLGRSLRARYAERIGRLDGRVVSLLTVFRLP